MWLFATGALRRMRRPCNTEMPGDGPRGCTSAGAHHRIGDADKHKQPDAVVRVYVYLQPRAAHGRPEDGLQQAGQDLQGALVNAQALGCVCKRARGGSCGRQSGNSHRAVMQSSRGWRALDWTGSTSGSLHSAGCAEHYAKEKARSQL